MVVLAAFGRCSARRLTVLKLPPRAPEKKEGKIR